MKKEISVSIIIPAFNAEKHISEAIQSAIDQSYDNLEIICVSDGSTDNTEAIITELSKRDHRVRLICQENIGRGGARNTGLRHAQGAYTLFLDADDYLANDALEKLVTVIKRDCVDYVIGRTMSFSQHKKWVFPIHQKYYKNFVSQTSLVDSPFIMRDGSVCNKLFDSAFLKAKSLIFQPKMAKEDFLFGIEAAFAAKTITIITDIVYYYRANEDEDTISGTQRLNNEFFSDMFKASLISDQLLSGRREEESLKIEKDLALMDMLKNRIPRKVNSLKNEQERHEFQQILVTGLKTISNEGLIELPMKLYLFCVLMALDDRKLAFQLYDHLGNLKTFIKNNEKSLTKLEKQQLLILLQKASSADSATSEGYNLPSKVIKILKVANRLKTQARGKAKNYYLRAKRLRNYSIEKLTVSREKTKIAFIKSKPIWIMGERYGNHAGDNAFVLFEYLQKNYAQDIDAYFVLRSSAPQFERLKSNPKLLTYNSPRHLEIFKQSDVILFTDKLKDVCENQKVIDDLLVSRDLSMKSFIMLHHGVMYLKTTAFKNYHKDNFGHPVDAYIANSDFEKSNLINHSGFKPEQIMVSGFPRFDGLLNFENEKRYILLMPTWRRGMKNWNKTKFMNSFYFKQIQSFLNNPKLHEYLQQRDHILKFHVHFNMVDWLETFESKSKYVQILSPKNINVTNLLNDCSLLITDFSAICFDVAYMNKPVIFYDLGMETEDKLGQAPISENFEAEIFGEYLTQESQLVEEIRNYLENNFSIKPQHAERMKLFFKHHDNHNTQRVFEHVTDIFQKKQS